MHDYARRSQFVSLMCNRNAASLGGDVCMLLVTLLQAGQAQPRLISRL